jgi:hypothetical protein
MTTALGRLARTVGWLVLAIALALGGSGLIAETSHPPGDDHREELTYAADVALAPRLDDVSSQLSSLASVVDQLSNDARTALAAVSGDDATAVQTALASGSGHANQIVQSADAIRASIAGLPGDGPGAATIYSNATLVRRADLVAALGSLSGIADQWASVTRQATTAAQLTQAIRTHDSTLAAAAAQGVEANYTKAIALLTKATASLDQVTAIRQATVTTAGTTVLDDWISVHQTYDAALLALYQALKKSGGQRNAVVDAAYRAENAARQNLPSDDRAIIVIVSEVAQGGLNQAVVAIEDARGRIDEALAALGPEVQPGAPGS